MSKILSHPYLIAAALLGGNQATPLPELPLVDQPPNSLNPDLLKNSPKETNNLPSNLFSNSSPDDFSNQFLSNPSNNFSSNPSNNFSSNPSNNFSSNLSNKSLSNSSSNLLVNFSGNSLDTEDTNSNNLPYPELSFSAPNFDSPMPRFTPPPELPRPKSGSQMLYQRIAALQAGVTYTRIPTDSFVEYWQKADPREPTYEQWQSLLIQEAKALAKGQGANSLSIIVGDSLSMWFPTDKLSKDRLWLNQGISGENTTQILRRLKYKDFAQTRPDRIYVMAGINDLRQGVDDQTILAHHRQIIRLLLQDHLTHSACGYSRSTAPLSQPTTRKDFGPRGGKFSKYLR